MYVIDGKFLLTTITTTNLLKTYKKANVKNSDGQDAQMPDHSATGDTLPTAKQCN